MYSFIIFQQYKFIHHLATYGWVPFWRNDTLCQAGCHGPFRLPLFWAFTFFRYSTYLIFRVLKRKVVSDFCDFWGFSSSWVFSVFRHFYDFFDRFVFFAIFFAFSFFVFDIFSSGVLELAHDFAGVDIGQVNHAIVVSYLLSVIYFTLAFSD